MGLKTTKGRVNHEINFHLRVFQETSIKNALFTVVQNGKFKTVKYTEDCLQQYITNRCWLIESGLGNTASISFPPPLPSFFLSRRMEHNGLGCLAFLMSAEIQSPLLHILQQLPILHSSFHDILSLFILLQFTIHTSPSVFLSDILGSEEKTHICCPVPSQGVNKPVVFMCMCVCVRFLFRLSQPVTFKQKSKGCYSFLWLKNKSFYTRVDINGQNY